VSKPDVAAARDSGAIMVEYVFVIALFTFPVCMGFFALGIPLLRYFRYAQLALVGPFP
jgi:hypothetical protein